MPIQNPEITNDPLNRIHERKQAEGYVNLYANNAQLVSTYFDFQLSFGEIIEVTPERVVTEEIATVKMSPQLARRLRDIIIEQVSKYEETYGIIPTGPHQIDE
jgi:Protein of unknown function (DUF3467)